MSKFNVNDTVQTTEGKGVVTNVGTGEFTGMYTVKLHGAHAIHARGSEMSAVVTEPEPAPKAYVPVLPPITSCHREFTNSVNAYVIALTGRFAARTAFAIGEELDREVIRNPYVHPVSIAVRRAALAWAVARVESGRECTKYRVSYRDEDLGMSQGKSGWRCILDDGHDGACQRPAPSKF